MTAAMMLYESCRRRLLSLSLPLLLRRQRYLFVAACECWWQAHLCDSLPPRTLPHSRYLADFRPEVQLLQQLGPKHDKHMRLVSFNLC